jgi:lipopolysaccharide export system protein LptA
MSRQSQRSAIFAAGMAGMLACALPALAQTSKGPANALQGFSQNRDKPVQIEASTLEVRDRDKVATFLGNVNVTQGDTNLRCKTLVVFYDQEVTQGAKSPQPGIKSPQIVTGGQQQIRRLEAKGDVVVTQKDQKATGDTGVFDMKTNTVTLIGNVMMTQGQNIVRGERLVVDLTSGVSRVESGKNGQGRVEGLLFPGSVKDAKSETRPETPRARDTAKPPPIRQPPIY